MTHTAKNLSIAGTNIRLAATIFLIFIIFSGLSIFYIWNIENKKTESIAQRLQADAILLEQHLQHHIELLQNSNLLVDYIIDQKKDISNINHHLKTLRQAKIEIFDLNGRYLFPQKGFNRISIFEQNKSAVQLDGNELSLNRFSPILSDDKKLYGFYRFATKKEFNLAPWIKLSLIPQSPFYFEIYGQQVFVCSEKTFTSAFNLALPMILNLFFFSLFIYLIFYMTVLKPIRRLLHLMLDKKTTSIVNLQLSPFSPTMLKTLFSNIQNNYLQVEKSKANLKLLFDELKEEKTQLKTDQGLIKILTHDLSNPLNTIKAACEMRHHVNEPLSKKHQSLFDKIARSIDLCESIVNHTRDMLAAKQGKQVVTLRPTSMEALFEDLNFIFEDKLLAKKIELKLINETKGMLFLADQNLLLNHVMNNLISNSIKFSYENSQITITCFLKEQRFWIKIEDHGCGIEPDLIPNLFRSDKKTSTLGTMGEHGTGFGLPLAKTYVDKLNGTIEVTSISAKNASSDHPSGTTFLLSFAIDQQA